MPFAKAVPGLELAQEPPPSSRARVHTGREAEGAAGGALQDLVAVPRREQRGQRPGQSWVRVAPGQRPPSANPPLAQVTYFAKKDTEVFLAMSVSPVEENLAFEETEGAIKSLSFWQAQGRQS